MIVKKSNIAHICNEKGAVRRKLVVSCILRQARATPTDFVDDNPPDWSAFISSLCWYHFLSFWNNLSDGVLQTMVKGERCSSSLEWERSCFSRNRPITWVYSKTASFSFQRRATTLSFYHRLQDIIGKIIPKGQKKISTQWWDKGTSVRWIVVDKVGGVRRARLP